jgi:hypothetical protein
MSATKELWLMIQDGVPEHYAREVLAYRLKKRLEYEQEEYAIHEERQRRLQESSGDESIISKEDIHRPSNGFTPEGEGNGG